MRLPSSLNCASSGGNAPEQAGAVGIEARAFATGVALMPGPTGTVILHLLYCPEIGTCELMPLTTTLSFAGSLPAASLPSTTAFQSVADGVYDVAWMTSDSKIF